MATPAVQPVKISHNALVSRDPALSSEIERAFDSSPDALGLLIVSDLPTEFAALRKRLLHLADKFATLPQSTREQYARPPDYSFGWSHGKEVMNGKPDLLKGSFYNNPKEDVTPGLHEGDEPIHNVWPKEKEVEGFEGASQPNMLSLKSSSRRRKLNGYLLSHRRLQATLQVDGRHWRAGRERMRRLCRQDGLVEIGQRADQPEPRLQGAITALREYASITKFSGPID